MIKEDGDDAAQEAVKHTRFSPVRLRNAALNPDQVQELVRTMTAEEFALVRSGQTKTKPKMIRNPETGEFFRLVPGDFSQEPPRKPYYEPIALEPTKVIYLESSKEIMDSYRHRKALRAPEGVEMKTYRLQPKDSREASEGEISRKQLFALMSAIGRDSRWWSIEDPFYDAQGYFEPLTINVMFKHGKPIGVAMWEEPDPADPTHTYASFMGLVEHERSIANSGFLMKWMMKSLADKGVDHAITTTSAHDSLLNIEHETPLAVGDEIRKGLCITDVIDVHASGFAHTPRSEHPGHYLSHTDMNMSPDFYTDPDTGKTLPRYEYAALIDRLNHAFGVGEAVQAVRD